MNVVPAKTAYCDGGSRGNPGPSACAYVYVEDDRVVWSDGIFLGTQTNNYAEYKGLLHLLRTLADEGISGVTIYCDSLLVVNQVTGKWNVKHEVLKPFANEAMFYCTRMGHKLEHVRGHVGNKWNEYVDRLCNETMDEEAESAKA